MSQCRGHRGRDINLPVCKHRSRRAKATCRHRRCNNCTIVYHGSYRIGGFTLNRPKTYSVGTYPGAVAVEEELREECEGILRRGKEQEERELEALREMEEPGEQEVPRDRVEHFRPWE